MLTAFLTLAALIGLAVMVCGGLWLACLLIDVVLTRVASTFRLTEAFLAFLYHRISARHVKKCAAERKTDYPKYPKGFQR